MKPRKDISQTICSCLLALLVCSSPSAVSYPGQNQIALSQPLVVKWRYQSDQTSNLTPAADKTTVFLPLAAGTLIALNSSDGKLIWRAETGGEFSAAPTTDDRSVYAATRYPAPEQRLVHGTLRALSKTTGVTLWMRTLSGPLGGSLAAGDNALFAGSADGRVYAFDKHTGLTLWINQYSEGFSSEPLLSGKVVYFGSDSGNLVALDQSTGRLVWQYRTHGAIQGPIYLLSLHKGALIWRRQLPGRIPARPITAPDGALFTPLSTDSAIVLSLHDGKPANTLSLGEENSSSAAPIAVDNLIVIATSHGLLAFAAPQQGPE